MPRYTSKEANMLYRAVVTEDCAATTHSSAETYTEYLGPYNTKGAASAAITRAKGEAGRRRWSKRTVTGYVESAPIVWTKVEGSER